MGIATKEDLLYPWKRDPNETVSARWAQWWPLIPPLKFFLIIGLMDGLGNILGLIATPYVSPQLTSILPQTIVVFTMICGILILGTRYSLLQCLGAAIVVSGAVVSIIPQFSETSGTNKIGDDILLAMSTLPNAISFTLKELIFIYNKDLDLFVVNTTGSLFQLILSPFMVPLSFLFDSSLDGYSFYDFLKYGARCFVGVNPPMNESETGIADCDYNPWPYLVYIIINIIFNISLLALLKKASALTGFLVLKAIVPFSVILFYIPWPIISQQSFDVYIIIGLVIILLGLAWFRFGGYLQSKYLVPESRSCLSIGEIFLAWSDAKNRRQKNSLLN
eukprot:TRINITY_DN2006_c0_g1_i1.p1 TRINITY_DN2006_c0_g1~~TRINITY_DN2006_c0_g1_i1.p1  ORF type:complete len:334 (-),score=26.46 TRINITY_DN2006_c0_g1_i1:10-1011(-)